MNGLPLITILLGLFAKGVAAAPPDDALATLQRMSITREVEPAAVVTALTDGLETLAALRAGTRSDACRAAFMAGEMHRFAAAAGAGADHEVRAIEAFRALRVEFIDLRVSGLGYIGEARVRRQQGRHAGALAALTVLFEAGVDPRLQRLAGFEALESLLFVDIDDALRRAESLGAEADWVRARGLAKKGETEAAMDLVRSDALRTSVGVYERLALIDEFGVLRDDERAEWARILTQLGHVDRALSLLRSRCPDGAIPLFAHLLELQGAHDEAAAAWQRVEHLEPADQLRAAEVMLRAGRTDDAVIALRAVLNSSAEAPLRRAALQRYVSIVGLEAARAEFEAHLSLVADDPYLRYCAVALRMGQVDPAYLRRELERLDRDDVDPGVRASAVLLRGQLDPDRRRALLLLDSNSELLNVEVATAIGARQLRVRCLIELGMVDAAVQALEDSPADQTSAVLIAVAGALADRIDQGYGEDAAPQAVRFAALAIERSPADVAVAFEAATIMSRAGATADSERVLVTLDSPAARLLQAELAIQRGDAEAVFDRLIADDTSAAQQLRARAAMMLGRFDDGAVAARAARRAETNGSDAWWTATLLLVRAQLGQGHADAARAMLRVSEALHPVTARRKIYNDLELLKQELN